MPERIPEIYLQTAESHRVEVDPNSAAAAAASGLRYLFPLLTPDAVKKFCEENPDSLDLAVVACLAGIHIRSLTSRANSSVSPLQVYSLLVDAGQTLNAVFRNESLRTRLREIGFDHLGRSQNFLLDIALHESKLLQSGVPLVPDGLSLARMSEGVLAEVYHGYSMGEDNPSRALIGIEYFLLKSARAEEGDINEDDLFDNFLQLRNALINDEPHKVATLASRLMALSKKNNLERVGLLARETYEEILSKKPEWSGMAQLFKLRLMGEQARAKILHVLSPRLLSKEKRNELFDMLKKESTS